MKINQALSGLIAAPHTPMHADGSIRPEIIEQQVEQLVRDGVTGAFICGSTGEGMSLSVEERKQIARRWVDVAKDDLTVIVHVGHHSLPEACDLAAHAAAIGADAISTVAPAFYRPVSVEDLVDFCRPIAAAAPGTAFYYYHSPGMTGVSLSPARFLDLAAAAIPTLAGIKFNDGNLMAYQQCLTRQEGRFDIPFGVDEALLGALAYGARAAVGSTYNYAAPVFHRLIKAFNAGDLDTARLCASRATRIVELLIEYGPMPASKAAMAVCGIDAGPPRLPLRALSPQRREEYLDRLRTIVDPAGLPRVDGVNIGHLPAGAILEGRSACER